MTTRPAVSMVIFMVTNYGVGLVARNDWPQESRVADLRPMVPRLVSLEGTASGCILSGTIEEVVGTGWNSIAVPQQVRAIGRSRLLERIGALSDAVLQSEIENRQLEHFGIAYEIEEL
jgi:hypothetical protein